MLIVLEGVEDKLNKRERSVDSIYYLCGSGGKTCVSIRLEIAAGLRHTCLLGSILLSSRGLRIMSLLTLYIVAVFSLFRLKLGCMYF